MDLTGSKVTAQTLTEALVLLPVAPSRRTIVFVNSIDCLQRVRAYRISGNFRMVEIFVYFVLKSIIRKFACTIMSICSTSLC